MILSVTGTLELFICTQCKERWIGQGGEPRTQEWLKAHDGKHGQLNVPIDGEAPRGFDRPIGFFG